MLLGLAHPCSTTARSPLASFSVLQGATRCPVSERLAPQRRRELLLGLALLPAASLLTRTATAGQPVTLQVGAEREYRDISSALAAAPCGSMIQVAPGVYRERIVVSGKDVTICAQPEGAEVVVEWLTDAPYQSVVQVGQGAHTTLRGLTLRHRSPSVANNYAVFLQGGSLSLVDCTISSRSGGGVAVEGGACELLRCEVADCERTGVSVFQSLEGDSGSCRVEQSRVRSCGKGGLLARDGGEVVLVNSEVTGNSGYGIALLDCTADVRGNTVSRNTLGSILLSPGADLGGADAVRELVNTNALDTPPVTKIRKGG